MLECFQDGEAHEVNEISARVGVSRQTVMKCLYFYMLDNLIIPAGKGASGSSGGKKPLLYSLNPDLYLICVTLWNRAFIVNLFNVNGVLIDRIALDIPLPESLNKAAENIGRLTDLLLQKNSISIQHVRGVSVSLPGNVDINTNRLIFSSSAPEWGINVPMADYLKPFFSEDTLILLMSSTKLISIPYLQDPELARKRLLVITVTLGGVSGTLIQNGHILNGTNSLIGEIGHIIIDPDDEEVCTCGCRGCLNVRVSPKRIRENAQRERDRNPGSVLLTASDELPYNAIFQAALEGDPLAMYCAEGIVSDFVTALHNISTVYDPDYVIFTGNQFIGNEMADRMFFERLRVFRHYPVYRNPFRIVFDNCDLIGKDAQGAMLALRWTLLNRTDPHDSTDHETA